MKAFQANRSSCGPLPFNVFTVWMDRFCYGLRLTQNCMLMQGHNLLENLLAKKQSPTNEASGFQPLLSRRCKFRELPSASQHFVVRRQAETSFDPRHQAWRLDNDVPRKCTTSQVSQTPSCPRQIHH